MLKITKEDVLNGLKRGDYKKMIIFSTSNISSPGGRFDMGAIMMKMNELGLNDIDKLYDESFFRTNPEIEYTLSNETLRLTLKKPTLTHHFIRMLYEKGYVQNYLTLNLDGLDEQAGFKPEEFNWPLGVNVTCYCTQCY